MSTIEFNVYSGKPEEVHAGTMWGIFRLRKKCEREGLNLDDTAVVLRAVANEIDKLRIEYPDGQAKGIDINSPDFAMSLAAAILPSQVEQPTGALHV